MHFTILPEGPATAAVAVPLQWANSQQSSLDMEVVFDFSWKEGGYKGNEICIRRHLHTQPWPEQDKDFKSSVIF